jgi:sporulation protein YlmC with PRC-barrel domain
MEVAMKTEREDMRVVERKSGIPQPTSLMTVSHQFWCRGAGRSGANCLPIAAVLWVTAAVLVSAIPQPARSQAVQIIEVDVKGVAQGYRASKLKGHDVINDKNEDVGEIDDIVIGADKKSLFAVLEVGGFLGIGGKLIAVPLEQLNIDPAGTKITLPGASKDTLQKLPALKYSS